VIYTYVLPAHTHGILTNGIMNDVVG